MPPDHDVVLRGGTLYDGSGRPPIAGDVAIDAEHIAAVGVVKGRGAREIDARGLAVAPGFVNMLSWAIDSLFAVTPRRFTVSSRNEIISRNFQVVSTCSSGKGGLAGWNAFIARCSMTEESFPIE